MLCDGCDNSTISTSPHLRCKCHLAVSLLTNPIICAGEKPFSTVINRFLISLSYFCLTQPVLPSAVGTWWECELSISILLSEWLKKMTNAVSLPRPGQLRRLSICVRAVVSLFVAADGQIALPKEKNTLKKIYLVCIQGVLKVWFRTHMSLCDI